jgi:sugar phosphate isomerase/epimerase
MQFGLKVYGNKELSILKSVVNNFDFIEIMALKENNYKEIGNFGLPIIVHNKHSRFGINFANPKKEIENKNSLDYAITLADKLDSKFIIVHSEFREDINCSEEQITRFIEQYDDDRILIENMPGPRNGKINFGDTFESIKRICSNSKKSMCLDIGHAALTANYLHINTLDFLKKMNSLDPKLYHVCDVNFAKMIDHLTLGTGDLCWPSIMNDILPKDACLSIETRYDDVENKRLELQFIKKQLA